MKLTEYQSFVADTLGNVLEILAAKSHDYANEEETLLNFMQMHELCKVLGIKPEESLQDNAWFYVLMKLQRILNLRGQDPANEAVGDSLVDLINYSMLAVACGKQEFVADVPRFQPRVYVSGPYGRRTGASQITLDENVQKAIDAGIKLINAGYIPLIPHLYHYVHQGMYQPIEEEKWLDICLAWIPTCDALVRLPGYSVGSDREVQEAGLLGIPVYKLEELI